MVRDVVLELVLLIFPLFLPGYFLVNVFFPGRGSLGGDWDAVYRVFLGVVLSVALTVIYGTLLIVVAGADQVLLRPETLWPGLALLALALFLAGVVRGAYPRIARVLGRTPAPPGRQDEVEEDVLARLLDVTARLEAAEAGEGGDAGDLEALRQEKRRLEEEAARRA
ncbi:MAG: hypothetical protein ACE5JE_01905 [Thermoplasmata archaeon]